MICLRSSVGQEQKCGAQFADAMKLRSGIPPRL
jgi:hypothetical protein